MVIFRRETIYTESVWEKSRETFKMFALPPPPPSFHFNPSNFQIKINCEKGPSCSVALGFRTQGSLIFPFLTGPCSSSRPWSRRCCLQATLPGPSGQASALLWAVPASLAFALQNATHTLAYLFPPNGAQPGLPSRMPFSHWINEGSSANKQKNNQKKAEKVISACWVTSRVYCIFPFMLPTYSAKWRNSLNSGWLREGKI